MKRQQRENRIRSPKCGASGTSSADFFHLVEKLYRQAKTEAKSLDGNTTIYTWAALPMLVSGLSALVVEREAMFKNQRDERRVHLLLTEALPDQFKTLYKVRGGLLGCLKQLVQLRNEIIHPAHLATGPVIWPRELSQTKKRGLLNSPPKESEEYLLLDQLKSLRLLEWAMQIVEQLKKVVADYHGKRALRSDRQLYKEERDSSDPTVIRITPVVRTKLLPPETS